MILSKPWPIRETMELQVHGMSGYRQRLLFLAFLIGVSVCTVHVARAQFSASDTVTLDVRDGDLRETLLKLADRARINILVSPKVKGNVTFRVTDMEPLELIQFLSRANGLIIERHGRILLIMADENTTPSRVRFEVIPLQNAKAEEVTKIIQNLKLDKRTSVTHDTRTNRLIVVYPE